MSLSQPAAPATDSPGFLDKAWQRLKSWEGMLLAVLLIVVVFNAVNTPSYLTFGNWVNLFQLYIEKIIIALIMTFIIINGEIDLSVASIMALSAALMAFLHEKEVAFPLAVLIGLLAGLVCGLFNGFWIAFVGLPSLVVTLATLIAYRGLALVLVQDRSIGNFPVWFSNLGQKPLVGGLPFALILFIAGVALAIVILQYSGFGRSVYVIGNNKDVARYSGVNVRRVKMWLFIASGFIAGLAGILYAAHLGAMRGSTADGFELDIITMVLLGGVSIFGGTGSLWGVLLSILIILNLRNGMGLANISGEIQKGFVGVLLILSVLAPNIFGRVQESYNRRRRLSAAETAEA
ncbi:MAG: ABC transporter permease [Anaerolineae bacterium]|nr:ABC transporter permease [Anaerolineae bacterium]